MSISTGNILPLRPVATAPEPRAFYTDMNQRFPDMDALTDEELDADPDLEDRIIEYSTGTRLICMAFPWSRVEQASIAVETTALRHGVAITWVSESTTTVPIQRP